VIVEPLYAWALPTELVAHRSTWLKVAQTYKQLNAPFGTFGQATLIVSTRGMKSGSWPTIASTASCPQTSRHGRRSATRWRARCVTC